jgi:hypothetical protein
MPNNPLKMSAAVLYQISKSMTDIHARMLAKPAFVVTQIKKNGIRVGEKGIEKLS